MLNIQVKVEMMLVEGDNVAKAIVDLVANLNIRKLVIGTNQSNLRYHVYNSYVTLIKLNYDKL